MWALASAMEWVPKWKIEAASTAEAADVLFHLLVMLRARGVPLAAVMAELARRQGRSGLEEKAARPE